MSTCEPLIAIHRELDAMFAMFRELVLIGDGPRAAAVLASYTALTARHAADEEAALLPHLGDDARWPAELYLGQHVKLFAGLDRLAAAVATLRHARPGWRAQALVALDAAAPLHHLVEHHHLAEEQDLFVRAAATAPAAIATIAAAWRHARTAHDAVLAEARAALLEDVADA